MVDISNNTVVNEIQVLTLTRLAFFSSSFLSFTLERPVVGPEIQGRRTETLSVLEGLR